MKKLTLVLTLLGVFLAINSFAADKVKIGSLYYYLYSSGGVRTASVAACEDGNYSGDIVIPEKVYYNAYYTVNRIFSYAFCYDREVTSVTIPNTVKEIGINAFLDCKGLKTLTIPASVTKLETDPFGTCLLDSLTIECTLDNYKDVFKRLDTKSIIYCNKSEISKIKKYFSGEVYEIGTITKVEKDGLRFKLNCTKNTATVLGRVQSMSTLENLVIPATVEANGTSYNVTNISASAFYKDVYLVSITMPSTITEIGNASFEYCAHLLNVDLSPSLKKIPFSAFSSCSALKSITIPEGVTVIERWAFSWCHMLGSSQPLHIPSTVRTIDRDAFFSCSNMKAIEVDEKNKNYSSVDGILYDKYKNKLLLCPAKNITGAFVIPEEVYTIGADAFHGCKDITSITMTDQVGVIEDDAFDDCVQLKKIRLSRSLYTLGNGVFRGCSQLETLVLPRGLTKVGGELFSDCKLKLVVILCPISNLGYGDILCVWNFYDNMLGEDAAIYTYYPDAFADRVSCPVYELGTQNTIENIKTYLCGAEFDVPTQGKAKPFCLSIGEQSINASADEHYFVKGLDINHNYEIIGQYRLEHHDYSYEDVLGNLATNKLVITINDLTSTQSTIKGTVSVNSDETWQPDEVGATLDSREAKGTNFVFKDLAPYRNYTIYPYARKGENKYLGSSRYISTLSVQPALSTIRITPTTLEIRGSYSEGDAKVVASEFPGYDSNGKTLLLTGLDPKTTYSVTYTVQYSTGGKESVSKNFTTTGLELESLEPKVINLGEAIVCAKTNMADEETNAGFEWRKVDAPDVVPSKSALAVIYDGTLEGIIKNMATTSYYKVRPYYESKSGKKYYGEWIGIDPSDFSYFEPTVHTYASIDISNGAIILSGYVLQGSDEILGQGFEYWPMMNMSAPASASGQNVTRVDASGQRMSVSLTGLEPNVTYGYRAFVKTVRGMKYGEERTFACPEELLDVNNPSVAEQKTFTVYNLRGSMVRRDASSLKGLPKGIYIVNGKKKIVK